MHVVIFGLCVSSSWGNGHATLWRGLLKAMARRGHTATFFEKDVPYYAAARDGWQTPRGVHLRLYSQWDDVRAEAARELQHTDLALFTSYCADGREAADLILASRAAIKAFYDLDTPVTLDALKAGRPVPYLPAQGLGAFDRVLSYTGGVALDELRALLHARMAEPLYGWVDPETHAPVAPVEELRSALSYLGTYAADRQGALEELLLTVARRRPREAYLVAGAQYPASVVWPENVRVRTHLPPAVHPAFFCSSRVTLNITRAAMAANGYCPSGRLFEAAACGVPILSDVWPGLDMFFEPGREILLARTSDDAEAALSLTDAELNAVAQAARARTLACHTAERRCLELEAICDGALGQAA